MEAAKLIRASRRRRGLTQAELATALGKNQSAIARWEAGKVSPRVETLVEILRACGLDLELRLHEQRQANDELDQIRERLSWTPAQRLRYLTDMLAFEERAQRARRLGRLDRQA